MAGTILLYGGTGGIGSALAKRLKDRGFDLHLVARDAARLEKAAGELGASFTAADVEDPAAFDRVAEEAGPSLAGFAYAVGSIDLKPLGKLDAAAFERDFRINALGAALALRAAAPALQAGEGTASAVLFSATPAAQGFANHAAVAMAKGAVQGLVLAAAAELAPKVRVNAVAPSLVRTPLSQTLVQSAELAEAIAAMHAIPRLGEPDDAAAMAAFLLSPDAGWITGQVIGVDGGRSTVRTKG